MRGGGVLAEHGEEVGARVAPGQLGERVGGVARAAAVDLARGSPRGPGRRDGRLDEGEAVLGRR